MNILALEFSTNRRSVGFSARTNIATMSVISEEAVKGDSPFNLIRRAIGSQLQVDELVVGLGPGSYTGIRSSLAIAQGYHLANGALAAGVSSADAIAFAASKDVQGELEIVIDAQRGEVYSAIYSLNGRAFSVVEPLQILPRPRTNRIAGPEATKWNSDGLVIFPDAAAIALLASQKATFLSPELLEPIYLREPSFVKAPAPRHT